MTVHTVGRVAVLRCHAPLSGGPDPEQILTQIERSGAREVLLDTMEADWADSGGLRWLLALQHTLAARGHSLSVAANVEGKVWRNVALLEAGFLLFPSVRAAWRH